MEILNQILIISFHKPREINKLVLCGLYIILSYKLFMIFLVTVECRLGSLRSNTIHIFSLYS